MSTEKINIALHGGDPLSRAGLLHELGDQPYVTVWDRRDETDGAASEDVAVLIIDHIESTMTGKLRELADSMRERVVLVTCRLDETQLKIVLETGVRSIVWRHQATAEKVLQAAQSAIRGDSEMPSDLLSKVLFTFRGARSDAAAPPANVVVMTPRETQVLQLVAQGMSTVEIASRLSYSPRTVKGVLHNIMGRMQVKNRAHAVAHAIREGYI